MKKKLAIAFFTVVFLSVAFYSCQKQPVLKTLTPHLPAMPYNYASSNFQSDANAPGNNRMTDDGVTLGRLLFYDPRLSLNNTVSCASCHKQEFAFADGGAKSVGFEGKVTSRNSMAIINAGMKQSFFWDGRAQQLEDMVLMPVQNHVEMGIDKMEAIEQKINSADYYPPLFKKAFGDEQVTYQRIAKALSQFVRAISSSQSQIEMAGFTALQWQGQMAFDKYHCSTCHFGTNFGGGTLGGGYSGSSGTLNSANIGLDEVYEDKGVENINGLPASNGAFMIPSLRNLAYTAPYMHDGRYKTIEDVIEHYSSGIKATNKLDDNLTNAGFYQNQSLDHLPVKMNISTQEKAALAAFLRGLSDRSITTDVRFSNPFN